MRKVDLRMNEQYKYEVIKSLVDHNGNKKAAAVKLKCTLRTVNRLINNYKANGKEAFVHGNRNRKPATTFPEETKRKIVDLYINTYPDANLRHFSEIVKEDLGITVSDTTINSWLRDENVLSPKARKKTKTELRKKLKAALDESTSDKQSNELKEKIETLDRSMVHPRRSRSKYMGELLQMDASEYYWVPGFKWHLHVAIDDATGQIHGAYFDFQETLNGYYHVLDQILTNHGIPVAFLTDRRTVFEYKNKKSLLDEDDTFTQFAYACNQLGIDIDTTSVAPAKGRVERLNQTLQSRLPVELRREKITTIEQANVFLHSYIEKHNEEFALQLNSSRNAYEQQPTPEQIERTLAVLSDRIVDKGQCIRYRNKFYIPTDEDGNRLYFAHKTKCLVIESFTGNLYLSIAEQVYLAERIEEHEAVSRRLDPEKPKKKEPKKKYIPPMSHPWKRQSFIAFRNKQQHRISY